MKFTLTNIKPGDTITLAKDDAAAFESDHLYIISDYVKDIYWVRYDDGHCSTFWLARLLELATAGTLLRPQPVTCSCGAYAGQEHGEFCREWEGAGDGKVEPV